MPPGRHRPHHHRQVAENLILWSLLHGLVNVSKVLLVLDGDNTLYSSG